MKSAEEIVKIIEAQIAKEEEYSNSFYQMYKESNVPSRKAWLRHISDEHSDKQLMLEQILKEINH